MTICHPIHHLPFSLLLPHVTTYTYPVYIYIILCSWFINSLSLTVSVCLSQTQEVYYGELNTVHCARTTPLGRFVTFGGLSGICRDRELPATTDHTLDDRWPLKWWARRQLDAVHMENQKMPSWETVNLIEQPLQIPRQRWQDWRNWFGNSRRKQRPPTELQRQWRAEYWSCPRQQRYERRLQNSGKNSNAASWEAIKYT